MLAHTDRNRSPEIELSNSDSKELSLQCSILASQSAHSFPDNLSSDLIANQVLNNSQKHVFRTCGWLWLGEQHVYLSLFIASTEITSFYVADETSVSL
jgi:hypothetical protein